MREVSDWLSGYLKFVEHTESPTSYHMWCGLSMLAGALQRKVWLKWGHETIRPNLYVVLVGPSGKTRKGLALGIAKEMLSEIPGISVAAEATTREAIISAMRRAVSNFQDTDGTIKFHCSLTAFSEELSVFLGQNDTKFLATLTDWYDSRDKWDYETVGRGKDALQGVCFNLLGATAPDWLQSILPQEAVGGGFTSRILFIAETKKGKIVPKHDITEEEEELRRSLLRDLEQVNQMQGSFQFDEQSEASYTRWYEEEEIRLQRGEAAIEDPRFSGYCERRATHLRKLMMILSASRGDSRVMSVEDFDRGLMLLRVAEQKMPQTFGGLGQARYSDMTDKVISFVRQMGSTTRSVLLSRFYRDLDPQALKLIEESMVQMQLIEVKLLSKGDKLYEWIGPRA